jgi:hypothetical protein
MANTTTYRRAVLAGAAALPLASLPAIAAEPDPIFAAIEHHRATWIECCLAAIARDDAGCSGLDTSEAPEFAALIERSDALYEAEMAACVALTHIRPTSTGGVIALLAYVDDFNRGGLRYNSTGGYSEHHQWPDDLVSDDSDQVVNGRGKPLEMPFPYWIMRNVQAALTALVAGKAVAS